MHSTSIKSIAGSGWNEPSSCPALEVVISEQREEMLKLSSWGPQIWGNHGENPWGNDGKTRESTQKNRS